MRTVENIRTKIALFILKYANKLADFIQPSYKRVVLRVDMLKMATTLAPDRSIPVRPDIDDGLKIDKMALIKAVQTAEPLIDEDAEFEKQFPYLVERVRKTK